MRQPSATRHLLLAGLVWTGLVAAACDGGFDDEEAIARCDQVRINYPNGTDQPAYDACLVCFRDCGEECVVLGNVIPTKFSCPE